MIDRAQQAADAIDSVAALTAHQARSVLNEYTKDDLIAAIATGHGGQAGGGAATVKCVTVGIDHTDINITDGLADLYLLPETETLLCIAPVICTETFDGADSGATGFVTVSVYGPTGVTGNNLLSDVFDLTGVNAVVDGLMSVAPTDVTFVVSFLTGVTPEAGGGPVQLTVDFTNGNAPPLNSIGTQGHVDITLVLLVRS